MDESPEEEANTSPLPIRKKQQRQQLTKGMEHMRSYVTISDQNSTPQPANGNLGEDAYGVPASYEPIRKESNESRNTNGLKRNDPFQFGTRYLTNDDDIFAFNAWDHVEVDPQYNDFIQEQTAFQRDNQVSDFDKHRFNSAPEKWWDKFYSNNSTNFFKDRKWLVQEFPVLGEVTKASYGSVKVLEVGAGAGNTAFPLLAMNENAELRLWACDYSSKAVELIRNQPAYVEQTERKFLQAEVWDAASNSLPPGLQAGELDLVIMIFIFSALSPEQWTQAVQNVWELLKPGGEVLFRDYGRGDLAQVRFKKGRYLEENFYVRGDGTRVYFFEQEELRRIWAGDAASEIERDDAVASEAAWKRSGDAQANDDAEVIDKATQLMSEPARIDGEESQVNTTEIQINDEQAQVDLDAGQLPPEAATISRSRTEGAVGAETVPVADTGGNKEMPEVNGAGSSTNHIQDDKSSSRFEVVDLATDRRMLVNRQRKLKMYRCWLQGRFRKPDGTALASSDKPDLREPE